MGVKGCETESVIIYTIKEGLNIHRNQDDLLFQQVNYSYCIKFPEIKKRFNVYFKVL